MRKLIVIRIVHTPADMGSASVGLQREGISKIGKARWEENLKKIDKFWEELEAEVDGLGLDYGKTRIYQDGLPVAGDIGEKIVFETASRGSRNYQIIKKLMERGARIEATESPELLLQEYTFIKSIIDAKTDAEKAEAAKRYDAAKAGLLKARDGYIARRINTSLQDGETGLLLIGAEHDVMPGISGDIEKRALD